MTEIQKLKETGKRVGLIVSYHPPIFRPFKRLTQSTAKERIIIRAIESQIAVYSPHTAHDSLWGGVNDWILSCFHGNGLNGHVTPLTVKKIPDCKGLKFNVRGVESLHKLDEVVELLENNVTRECATTTEQTNIDGQYEESYTVHCRIGNDKLSQAVSMVTDQLKAYHVTVGEGDKVGVVILDNLFLIGI